MKKLLTAATASAIGLLAAGSAFATETRVNSMSGGAIQLTGTEAVNEKVLTLKDQANIYPFPQYLPDYKNSVDVDNTAGASYGSMNVRYALSDDAVLLLYGKRSAWLPVTNVQSVNGNTASGVAGYAPAPVDPTNHQFGIGFGMKAGETTRLGAHLGIGGANASGAKANDNTLVDFNAGVGFDVGETNKLDFGLGLRFGSFTNEDGTGSLYEPNGLFRLGLLFKGEFQVHDIAWLVPYLSFAHDSRGVAHAPNPQPNGTKQGSLSLTTLQLGSDLSIRRKLFDRDIIIQPGLGLAFATSTVSGNSTPGVATTTTVDNSSNRVVPYYGFSAEAHAFDWMILRLGARQQIVMTNIGNTAANGAPSNETHNSTVINTVTTGMGFQLMGWTLDINVNPAFFNQGIAVATGNATAGWGVDWALYYKWN